MSLGKMQLWVIGLLLWVLIFQYIVVRKFFTLLLALWCLKRFLYSIYLFQLSSVEDLVLINYLPIQCLMQASHQSDTQDYLHFCNNRNIYIFDVESKTQSREVICSRSHRGCGRAWIGHQEAKTSLNHILHKAGANRIYKTGPMNFCTTHLGGPTEITVTKGFSNVEKSLPTAEMITIKCYSLVTMTFHRSGFESPWELHLLVRS